MVSDRFRPKSHFIAPHSWSNDPCGAVYVPFSLLQAHKVHVFLEVWIDALRIILFIFISLSTTHPLSHLLLIQFITPSFPVPLIYPNDGIVSYPYMPNRKPKV
jgi:hypothetical protein